MKKKKKNIFLKIIGGSSILSIAFAMVISSAYSKSAPTGSPNAIREIFIPKGLMSLLK